MGEIKIESCEFNYKAPILLPLIKLCIKASEIIPATIHKQLGYSLLSVNFNLLAAFCGVTKALPCLRSADFPYSPSNSLKSQRVEVDKVWSLNVFTTCATFKVWVTHQRAAIYPRSGRPKNLQSPQNWGEEGEKGYSSLTQGSKHSLQLL